MTTQSSELSPAPVNPPFYSGDSITKFIGYLEEYLWVCPDKHITIFLGWIPERGKEAISCSHRSCDLAAAPGPRRNPNIFDNSMIADFTTCPRHAYYSHDLGLISTSEEFGVSTVAADAGNIWHKLMETLYAEPLTKDNLQTRHNAAVEVMMRMVKDVYPNHPRSDDQDPKRSVEHILQVFDEYIEHYFPKDGGLTDRTLVDRFNRSSLECVYDKEDKPMTEVNFAIELTDEILYAGRIDMIARHQGKLQIMDFKTSAINSKAREIREELSHQFHGYILGAQTVISEFLQESIEGVLVDSITWNKIVKPERDFRRTFIKHSQDALADWYDQVVFKITQIKEMRKTRMFPQNTQHCDRFMRACEYAMMCKSSNPKIVKGFIEGVHEQRFWSPVEGMIEEQG